MTDPRDEILRRQTPAVMVPRFGALEPIGRTGHRYLVAEDGLWLEVNRPWLHAVVPVGASRPAEYGRHALPFGRVEWRIWYAFSGAGIRRIYESFLADAVRAAPNECAAWGVYDETTGRLEYRPLVADRATPYSLNFHRPALPLHQHLAMDLHSHGTGAPYFSQTDDEDDRGEVKLSIVAGTVDAEPSWAARLCLLGLFIPGED